MLHRLAAILAVSFCSAAVLGAEPKLENIREVFEAGRMPEYYYDVSKPFSVRLTPDGKRLMYLRENGEPARDNDQPEPTDLLVRNLSDGKEIKVPLDQEDWLIATQIFRYSVTDPASRRMLLPKIVMKTVQKEGGPAEQTQAIRWRVVDLETGKASDTRVETYIGSMITFTPDGKFLVISERKTPMEIVTRIEPVEPNGSAPRLLTVPGLVVSCAPKLHAVDQADSPEIAAFYTYQPAASTSQPVVPPRHEQRLVLWDLTHDTTLGATPPPTWAVPDDRTLQWTEGGRYLFYADSEFVEQKGVSGPQQHRNVYVWDVQGKKPSGMVADAQLVGPGPGQWMVLAPSLAGQRNQKGIILFNAKTGERHTLGEKTMFGLHATAGKIVYGDLPEGSKWAKMMVADLVEPKGE